MRCIGAALVPGLVATLVACSASSGSGSGSDEGAELGRLGEGADEAPWDVRAGVEQITVTGADPGEPLTLYGRRGRRLLTLLADEQGQAHFAYLPGEHREVQSGPDLDWADLGDPAAAGVVEPGRYVIRDDSASPALATDVVTVPGRDDVPDTALYDRQELTVARVDVLGNVLPGSSLEAGFQYLEMRDGVRLSAMVRLPDPALYGEGPYPTVVEYSGYSPSNPASEEAGARLARTFGYATVSVNMRGTGCSGGVFDVFNPAQMADGYDVIEIVARQPWVLHGAVGMVGLSYSGITQLYTAATRPPHLAAVTAQSVIADPWLQAWPGGIFNSGFTHQWIKERDAAAAPGGDSWVTERIEAGDTTCAGHRALRAQNPDFEGFVRALDSYPASAAARDLRRLVGDIEAPVFISGAFQDEQTGPQFTALLDAFASAPVLRVNLWNGRHPDGYGPANLMRWFEFLEFYVAQRVPHLNPVVRALAPPVLAGQFQLRDVELEPDRFARFGDDHGSALAAYESEDPVRVMFESGIGENEVGEQGGTFELELESWPPGDAEPVTWYLGDDERLTAYEPGRRTDGDADGFEFDPDAGGATLFGGTGDYPLLDPVWTGADWTRFGEGEELSYLTEPLADDLVVAGPGVADLWVSSDVPARPPPAAPDGVGLRPTGTSFDVDLQASISEVRPDGVEYLVTNGWLRVGHRAENRRRTDGLEVVHRFTERAYEPLEGDEVVEARIDIPGFAHAFRAGSRLRLSIATPGRNHATWEFEPPDYGGDVPTVDVYRTRRQPSALVLSVVDGVRVPDVQPAPCPGLRGMACRPFVATENDPAT
ncbi:MAG: CocE/NonD family hydrolase [Acidimicrobiales bacterium]